MRSIIVYFNWRWMVLIGVLIWYDELLQSISIAWAIFLKMTVISVALRFDTVVNHLKHILCLSAISSQSLLLGTVFLNFLQNLARRSLVRDRLLAFMVVDADRRPGVGVESLISLAQDYSIRKGRMLSIHLLFEYLLAPVTFPDRTLDVCHRLVQS